MFRSLVLRALIAGTAIAGSVAVCGPAIAAHAPTTTTAGCPATVELQPMSFPTATGQRLSASTLVPDDGGALAPIVTVEERRTADSDELVLVIGAGAGAVVRPIYLAPDGCVIAWSNDVHPTADQVGRRSVHTPAFTLRLVSLTTSDCSRCMRAV